MTATREAVLDTARRSVALGLTHGTSGNVSARAGTGFAITPTGMPYDRLEAADIVVVDLEGRPSAGERRTPSSEWPMHAAVYRARPDVGAIVHGHSPSATAVACLGRDLPAFHYMIAVAGGDSVRCAPYAGFGTPELAGLAVRALTDRWACLLAQHGLLAAGRSLEHALSVAEEVEFLASVYLMLLPLGDPAVLGAAEMAEVIARFEGYGQQSPP